MSERFDAIVVGAGFGGLYMLHKLRQQGLRVRVFEAGDGVGGTWFWNRYPGARCDIESMEYSYQFDEALQQEWTWSEKYATQPEILSYINHVADRFDLRRDIQLETRVLAAHFEDGSWSVRTDDNQTWTAKYVVMATGCLSSANLPDIEGRDTFNGAVYHTGLWPKDGVDFTGKRVAVIGTGSSGIQSIPIIAEQAEHLTVYQRTANFSVPAHNRPLDESEVAQRKAEYPAFRQEMRSTAFHANFRYNEANALETSEQDRLAEYEARWQAGGLPFMASFADLMFDQQANATAAEFIRGKIEAQVDDPAVAELLSPNGVVGCKRLCVDTSYYATYNRPNVSLVDVNRQPIERIEAQGIVSGGRTNPLDAIIFATGFDAMTGALTNIDIKGQDALPLEDAWAEGPKTYLGLSIHGFPNLFLITGPGSPSVLTNMLPSIEHHVEWIAECIDWAERNGKRELQARLDAQEAWVAHVNEVGDSSLYPRCNSWYLGSNVPGKPRVFMPYLGFPPYAEKCAEVAASGYQGYDVA